MSTDGNATERGAERRPGRPPVWVAVGFIAAFAATILTVVLTGLYVRAPRSASAGDAAAAGERSAHGTAPEVVGERSAPASAPVPRGERVRDADDQ